MPWELVHTDKTSASFQYCNFTVVVWEEEILSSGEFVRPFLFGLLFSYLGVSFAAVPYFPYFLFFSLSLSLCFISSSLSFFIDFLFLRKSLLSICSTLFCTYGTQSSLSFVTLIFFKTSNSYLSLYFIYKRPIPSYRVTHLRNLIAISIILFITSSHLPSFSSI